MHRTRIRMALTLLLIWQGWGINTAFAQKKRNFDAAVSKIEAQVERARVRGGQTVTWRSSVELTSGWHTYPTRQTDPEAQIYVNAIEIDLPHGLAFVGELQDPPDPVVKPEPAL